MTYERNAGGSGMHARAASEATTLLIASFAPPRCAPGLKPNRLLALGDTYRSNEAVSATTNTSFDCVSSLNAASRGKGDTWALAMAAVGAGVYERGWW